MFWEDPFEELERMKRRLNKLMQRLGEPIEEELSAFGTFPVDISETEDEVVIKADFPGFEKEEIAIRLTENTVEISAQHKEKRIERTEKLYRAERRFGAVKRALTLPAAVEVDRAEADFKNGMLTVKVPKKEKKKVGKEIKIH